MENKNQDQQTGTPIVKKLEVKKTGKEALVLGLISVFVVLLGIGTGYLFSGKKLGSGGGPAVPKSTVTENEAGVVDDAAFPDSAEGMLVSGGIDGEGTHHLERDGGPSKNVYLTSTVIDLESFVDKKVTVWGQTISGQKAGWLMDVGRVKVID